MSESSYFLILSSVEKLCIFKPKTSRLSSYLIHWNISDASLGVEELGHLEIIGTIVHQLTRSMTPEEIKKAGYEAYFVDHTAGVYPAAASGFPWNAASMAVKGDLIADLTEDLAADGTTVQEQRGGKPLKIQDFLLYEFFHATFLKGQPT